MKAPLASVKDKFGDKKSLVAALQKLAGEELWLARTNEEKGLAHVSNSKLLKLHATFTAVKEKFGTRAKLIDAVAELEKHGKDGTYKTRLGAFPVPRLWDMYQSAEKRAARAEKAAKAAKAAPKAAPAKKKEDPKKAHAPKKAAKTAAPKTAAAK